MKSKVLTIWLGLMLPMFSAMAQEPLRTAWLISPNQRAETAAIQPEVQKINVLDQTVEIRSAGISLFFFGSLQSPTDHVERIRKLQFIIPRFPAPEKGEHTSVRPDVTGVFVNGIPIYNQFTTQSYQGQNLWHFDPIAGGDDGKFVASGRPQLEYHPSSWGLIEKLLSDSSGHSPIIGYAFDGYPIYGSWGVIDKKLQRMRSGYRLRDIKNRTSLPNGTKLTPGQYGPAVNAEFPLGSFVEDFEFVAGAGDLDEFNGRYCVTPEYPNGTYAYFLSADSAGRLAFPYLLAGKYFGKISAEELQKSFIDEFNLAFPKANPNSKTLAQIERPQMKLQVKGTELSAGTTVQLAFEANDTKQKPIRFLENVHERPLHLLIVSDDLSEFAHIHPELVAGDRYEVSHIFATGGRYRLYADFTPPGESQHVISFDLNLQGKQRTITPLLADKTYVHESNDTKVEMTTKQPLRAGEDVELAFTIRDKATENVPENLTPYLGAWAHFVIIDKSLESFIHAHPSDSQSAVNTMNLVHLHNEKLLALEPPPSEIHAVTSFPKPGIYKLWAQFQRGESVIAQPFVLEVKEASSQILSKVAVPSDAIEIKIGANGFSPALLEIPINKPTKIAITRDSQPNCGNKIVFPSLGISRDLPLGQTTIIELPAQPNGELLFSCGMGMYKGALVLK